MRINNKEKFLEKGMYIHHSIYNYSMVDYQGTRVPVSIICPSHGEFLQKPMHHLRGYGCQKCAYKKKQCYNKKRNERSKSDFVRKASLIHNKKYSYERLIYITARQKACITCPIHGDFWQMPDNHLSGQGCRECYRFLQKNGENFRRLTKNLFIKRAIEVHGHRYDYSKVKYINDSSKVTIICSIHGEFHQQPGLHIRRKSGCAQCNLVGGYSFNRIYADQDLMDKPSFFYVVNINTRTENFIKIGITSRSLSERFRKWRKYSVVNELIVRETSLGSAFALEQRILVLFKSKRYIPDMHIDGKTECFKPSALSGILQYINRPLV